MVDRVENRYDQPPQYRVDAARDALEEERGQEGESEHDEKDPDKFDNLRDAEDLRLLFNRADLWKHNIAIKVEDIDKIKVLGINLRTEPAVLKVRIFLYDGAIIPTAFLSISRSLGIKLRGMKESAFVDVNLLTKESALRVTIPKDVSQVDEEITKITSLPKEKTFSQTFKMFVSKKNWLQKLGLQDPVTKSVNNEILWVYATIVLLISVLSFGILYLLL